MSSIEIIDKIKRYLADRAEREPDYNNLIQEINAILSASKKQKIQIKIVSRSPALAEKLYQLSIAEESLRSLVDFQTVSPIKNIRQLIQNCDIACFIYDFSQGISDFEKSVIEKLTTAQIIPSIIVKSNASDTVNQFDLNNWLNQQKCPQLNNFLLPLTHFFNPYIPNHVDLYRQFIYQLSVDEATKLKDRIVRQVKPKIERYFALARKSIWQDINEKQSFFLPKENINSLQRKLNLTFQKIHRDQQQIFRNLKQYIHHSKGDLLNPFSPESLMCVVQQSIQKAEVEQIKNTKEIKLCLIINQKTNLETIPNYIFNICQEKINDYIEDRWFKINYTYEAGGLNQFIATIKTELEIISQLYPQEIIFPLPEPPIFQMNDIVCLETLTSNSEITFDYHFTQSSWFKLFVSLLIGLLIYLFTAIFLGGGRYFGFVILIYQFINLSTGQDVKNIKLKQQTKELKRILDSKYQALVRFCIERAVQDLVAALERENQKYQQQINQISLTVNQKLTQIQQDIAQQKTRIDNLKQDQAEIISLLSSHSK
ncbi:MAG: hypothetical protein Tsb0014_32400 [Pleurocapsa sp.]